MNHSVKIAAAEISRSNEKIDKTLKIEYLIIIDLVTRFIIMIIINLVTSAWK